MYLPTAEVCLDMPRTRRPSSVVSHSWQSAADHYWWQYSQQLGSLR